VLDDLLVLIDHECPGWAALSVTVFDGSHLTHFLPELRVRTAVDLEISEPVWWRKWNRWTNTWDEHER
jgi:hypothetical protein